MNSTTAGIAPVSTTPAGTAAGTTPAGTTPAGTTSPATTGPTGTTSRTRPFGAALAATALVVGAAGNTAQAVLTQVLGGRPDTVEQQAVVAAESPGIVTAMSLTGTVAVPFMVLGFVAAAHLLARRARRTGRVAGTLLVLGMWGFLGIQVAGVIKTLALLDGEAGLVAARWLEGLQSEPLVGALFAFPFFVGAALGMLVLTIGLLVVRNTGVPRWIPAVWLLFIVLDFTIGAVGPVDPHWLYLLGAVGLAHHVTKDQARAWRNH